MIELPVVEADKPFTPGVVLPNPFGKAVLDFLLLVAGGLRRRHVDRSLSLRVLVKNRRSAQIERSTFYRWCADDPQFVASFEEVKVVAIELYRGWMFKRGKRG